MSKKNMVTIKEAANALGVARPTIHYWINRGGLKVVDKKVTRERMVTRTYNVKHIDLDELRRLRGEAPKEDQ